MNCSDNTTVPETPGERLSYWLRSSGRSAARIVLSDHPDIGMEVDVFDLGNGYSVCVDTEDPGDFVEARAREDEVTYDIPKGFSNLSRWFTEVNWSPDCMHDSEFVGGGLAEVLANLLGVWRFPRVMWDEDEEITVEAGTDTIEGWMVLYAPHPDDEG